VYMAAYQPGARLEKHTDREQCEFSITLCVDYSPEPSLATPWPLHLDTPRGTVSVYQALGTEFFTAGASCLTTAAPWPKAILRPPSFSIMLREFLGVVGIGKS
jgi:hypothetical protein